MVSVEELNKKHHEAVQEKIKEIENIESKNLKDSDTNETKYRNDLEKMHTEN